mgnify:CR=1 FL=1
MKKIIIISLVTLVLAVGGGYYYFTGTPTYSLYQLKKSIENHDSITFNQYIDADRIIDRLVTDAMEGTETELSDNPFSGFAKTLLVSMKDEFKSSLNKSVEEISSGKDVKLAKLTIKNVTKEGKSASVTLRNPEGEELHLNMIKIPEGYWKIVSVNLDDFKKISPDVLMTTEKNDKGDQDKKLNLNVKFGEKVSIGDNWFIQVDKPELYTPSENDLSKPDKGKTYVTVSLQYFNEDNEEDDVNPENLTLKDKDNQGYKIIPWAGRTPKISDDDTVPAHDSLKGYLTYEVPAGTEIVKAVYSNSLATIVIE